MLQLASPHSLAPTVQGQTKPATEASLGCSDYKHKQSMAADTPLIPQFSGCPSLK